MINFLGINTMKTNLTDREKAFCDEYLKTGKVEQSGVNAGYSFFYNYTGLLRQKNISDYLMRKTLKQEKRRKKH